MRWPSAVIGAAFCFRRFLSCNSLFECLSQAVNVCSKNNILCALIPSVVNYSSGSVLSSEIELHCIYFCFFPQELLTSHVR